MFSSMLMTRVKEGWRVNEMMHNDELLTWSTSWRNDNYSSVVSVGTFSNTCSSVAAFHKDSVWEVHLFCGGKSMHQPLPADDPPLSLTYPTICLVLDLWCFNMFVLRFCSSLHLGPNQDQLLAVATGFKRSLQKFLPVVCGFFPEFQRV